MNQLIGVECSTFPIALRVRLTALLARDIDYVCDAAGAITEQIASGNVRGVVVSAKERLAALPDACRPRPSRASRPSRPSGWNMLFAPSDTAGDVDKLSGAVEDALNDAAFQKRLVDLRCDRPKPKEAGPVSSRELVRAEIGANGFPSEERGISGTDVL